jgi:hypothetical protein
MTFLDDVGKTLKQGTVATSHLITQPYKDIRSGVAYAGKHGINDVDKISDTISNPYIMYGVIGAVLLLLYKK